MKYTISPTNKKEKEEVYVLEDKDFLLIDAIRNLTNEIEKMRINNG